MTRPYPKIVMAGLVPATYAGTLPRQRAGTSPAMTGWVCAGVIARGDAA